MDRLLIYSIVLWYLRLILLFQPHELFHPSFYFAIVDSDRSLVGHALGGFPFGVHLRFLFTSPTLSISPGVPSLRETSRAGITCSRMHLLTRLRWFFGMF
ncbi:hypothetical protein FN846DRAFT_972961 [Sphaerosporella brunnea]|uniref:Secreted protein n=1 Tax=Sphaerosporella brunnea TaxID=1250544 RepID=A0A5J5EIH2_9PEZI|nr:hypothetical protein FN846DRAFT_972961 [Sphaerosporella brunnea]